MTAALVQRAFWLAGITLVAAIAALAITRRDAGSNRNLPGAIAVPGTENGYYTAKAAPYGPTAAHRRTACGKPFLPTTEGVAHPGWLLLAANTVLSGTVRLGPWIHVSSDASMYRTVTDGQLVSTRGRVRERFERKGHQFVALDVQVLADGELAMAVDHTAIYKVREPQ